MVYLLLADGFEEIEALAPVDFLRRAGVSVTTIGLKQTAVCGAHGIGVTADTVFDRVDFSDAEAIILPGGMPGSAHLDEDPRMTDLLASVYGRGGILAAICAAPLVLGKRGYLKGKEAICYPGFESDLMGATLSDSPVVCDGRIITAKSAAYAWQFGYTVAQSLVGYETCESVRKALFLPEYGA